MDHGNHNSREWRGTFKIIQPKNIITPLNFNSIISQLPYSQPFLFVDELLQIDENGVTGTYRFPKDSFFYEGHFKDNPVTPGVILTECMAMIGSVSNGDHQLTVSGKAGRSRWLGRRPRTRPVVMNPVDHPMGGGEGRSSGGHPRSRNGMPAKGYKTRKKNKASNRFIVSKRK